jgi:hypothetical protein
LVQGSRGGLGLSILALLVDGGQRWWNGGWRTRGREGSEPPDADMIAI